MFVIFSLSITFEMSFSEHSSLTSTNNEAMETTSDSSAEFLKSHGLEEYTSLLIGKHEFRKTSDLQLLARNVELLRGELPACVILKLKDAIEKSVAGGKVSPKSEISKGRLLELGKLSLKAQSVNFTLNRFNKLIGNEVQKYHLTSKWHGSGGLKICAGTTAQQATENQVLANCILKDNEISCLFGLYPIDQEGVVTIDKARGLKHIGSVLCSLRKTSSWHKKVPGDQAVILTLFYMGQKKLSYLNIRNLKTKAKQFSIPHSNDSDKDDIAKGLGRVLYEKGIVCRKDKKNVITYDNLELNT